MINYILSTDREILIFARGLLGSEYAIIIQILGESIVVFVALMLISLWLYGIRSKNTEYKKKSLRIFMTIILVFIIYGIINIGIPQWRESPDEVVIGVAPLIPHPIGNSFPSGHALFSAAALIGVWRYFRNYYVIIILIILGLATAIARVIGGVHYPGDIFGGFFFGFFGAIMISRIIIRSKFFEETLYPLLIKIAGYLKL